MLFTLHLLTNKMSGATIARWVIRRSTEYRKPWLIVVFSSTKKKRKRCTLAWTFPGHKSAKEIDKLRQKFVSHMDKKYMEIFIKQYQFLKSPRELLIGPGLTDLVSKYEDAYPL